MVVNLYLVHSAAHFFSLVINVIFNQVLFDISQYNSHCDGSVL